MKDTLFVLDLDGVVYDFLGGVLEYLKNRWGIRIKESEVYEFHLARLTDRDEVNRDLIAQITLRDEHENRVPPILYTEYVKMYPWAEAAIARLKERGDLAFCTSRPRGLSNLTRRQMQCDLGELFGPEVPFTMNANKVKATQILRRPYRTVIAFEDNLRQAQRYNQARVPVYLMKFSYNAQAQESWWLRLAENLQDAVDAYEKMYQGMEV